MLDEQWVMVMLLMMRRVKMESRGKSLYVKNKRREHLWIYIFMNKKLLLLCFSAFVFDGMLLPKYISYYRKSTISCYYYCFDKMICKLQLWVRIKNCKNQPKKECFKYRVIYACKIVFIYRNRVAVYQTIQ